jgi:ATP/maltotriose-dependent transcriptional regulator MalT
VGDEVYGGSLARVELAHAMLLTGNRDRAADVATEALRMACRGPHPWCIARALNVQGEIAHAEGDWSRATSLYQDAVTAFRAMRDMASTALVLTHLGEVARLRGDLDEAEHVSGESLALERAYNDGRNLARTLVNLGLVALGRGDVARAAALLVESLTTCLENDNPVLLASTLEALATVAAAAGAGERAARFSGAAESLRERIAAPRPPGTRLDHEVIDAGRAGLDGARFEALREAGRRLSPPEIMREADGIAGA